MVAHVDNANVRHRSKTSDDGSAMKKEWDDNVRNLKSRDRRTSSVFGAQATFSIFAFFIGIVILCMRYDAELPEPVSIADAGQREGPVFIQERARMMLKEMTNYGPRPTGSYENEVLTVEFLKFRLQMINQTVDRRFHEMKVDVQVVSGSFSMAFINDFASQYANVQNVVVKLEPSRAAGGSTGHAILINCHFDTAPFSPGASDDAASCVTMLEVLSVIAQAPLKMKHTLIFLFNGAEENLLQGSHGFVTQHPWAKEVRVFINLEACGSGGREVVFQAGPERYWLAEAYREAAVHPFASVIGQDVFESGLIPSDTDFRIFRDFGGLSGLDIAFVVNGYVYHTAYDTEDRLPAGSLQRAGDNVLSIVLNLANSSRIGEESSEKLVFFDILGLVMITYGQGLAFILSSSALGVACYCLLIRLKERSALSGKIRRKASRDVVLATGIIFLSWVGALGTNAFIAVLLDVFDKTMSFYGTPIWVFPLYVVPPVVAMSFLQRIVMFADHDGNGDGYETVRRTQEYTFDTFLDATRCLIVLIFFALSWSSRGSTFVPMLALLLPGVGEIVGRFLRIRKFGAVWLATYLFSQFIPLVVLFMYLLYGEYVFIPITGRAGKTVNPDVLVGCFTASSVVMYTAYLYPLLHLIPWRKLFEACGASISGLAILSLLLTNVGFPYVYSKEHPRLQRFLVEHTLRRFHAIDGRVVNEDSGYWMPDLDRHSPFSVAEYVPEIRDVKTFGFSDCEKQLWCHGPHYYPAIKLLSAASWLPGPKPVIKDPVAILTKSTVDRGDGTFNVTLRIRGPDHMTMVMSPKPGFELTEWSFSDHVGHSGVKLHDQPTYFAYFSFGLHPSSWDCWFLLKVQDSSGVSKMKQEGIMELGISGHALHGHQARDANLTKFLAKFPEWTYAIGWTGTYDHYIV